jgi:hypothetical protein
VTEQHPPFFLIIADHDREFLFVEGPMSDDRPWQEGARDARNNGRKIICGPAGPDRDALAAEYRRVHKLAGVPPGSILRVRPETLLVPYIVF